MIYPMVPFPITSGALEVIRNDTLEKGVSPCCCNYVCISFLRYSALSNGVTLKIGLALTDH